MKAERVRPGNVLKYSGSIVAFLIGSGFASGQEVMQFFTSYGSLWSGLGGLISLILFLWFTTVTLQDARILKLEDTNAIFEHYCGKIVGTVFKWITPVFLFMVYVIMISGAGALLFEFYGIPAIIGRAIMSLISLITVLLGLNRLVSVVGRIGPFLILFIIFIGTAAIITNFDGIRNADGVMSTLSMTRAAKYWWFSGIIYASFCAVTILPFLAGIGRNHPNRRELRASGILGSGAFMLTAIAVSYGMLAYIPLIYDKNVPAVFVSNLLFPGSGVLFSIVMYAGIYTTAVPMLWSSCNKISSNEKGLKFRLAVLILGLIAFFGGRLPFAFLVNIVYPYMGYLGVVLFIGMAITQIRGKRASTQAAGKEEERP
jgi:uncharacterized membrane protein YkvI